MDTVLTYLTLMLPLLFSYVYFRSDEGSVNAIFSSIVKKDTTTDSYKAIQSTKTIFLKLCVGKRVCKYYLAILQKSTWSLFELFRLR